MDVRVETINICKGVSIVSPFPAVYLEKEETLLVSDIHLGIEAQRESNGTHIPYDTLSIVLESIIRPTREMNCKKMYVLGDLKHQFGRLRKWDSLLVRRFIKEIRSAGAEPVIIRGNHDNHLGLLLKKLGVKFLDHYAFVSGFVLTHGDRKIKTWPDNKQSSSQVTIIGHEHPAVSLKDDLGIRQTFKTFLHIPGNNGSRSTASLIVLPSVNPLAYGSCINKVASNEYLSPYLRENRSVERAKPYVLEIGSLVLPFPSLGELSNFGS